MKGVELCNNLAEVPGLVRRLNRTSGQYDVMVQFDYAGACVAGGGADTEERAEALVEIDHQMVRDLLSFVEDDPESFADVYDAEVLKMLLDMEEK